MTSNDDYVLEIIQESGLVTEDLLEAARSAEGEEGGAALVENGHDVQPSVPLGREYHRGRA